MLLDTTIQIWGEGQQYIAHAMPIDVMSSGRTPDEARGAVDQAVRLFISTAEEAGTLEEVLAECGYVRDGEALRAPAFVSIERRILALAE